MRPVADIIRDLLVFFIGVVFFLIGIICLVAPGMVIEIRQKSMHYPKYAAEFDNSRFAYIFYRLMGIVMALVGGVMIYALMTSVT